MPAAEWIALAAASPRAQNSTAAPAALAAAAAAAAYDTVASLLIAIAAGLFAVLAAAIIQIARDEGREGRGRGGVAGTLKIELAMIAESIRPVDWIGAGLRGPYERRAVPRSTYGGLAGSGMLGGFDTRAQELPCRFYRLASLGDHAGMNAAIGQQVVLAIGGSSSRTRPGCAPSWGGRSAGGRRRRGCLAGRQRAAAEGGGRARAAARAPRYAGGEASAGESPRIVRDGTRHCGGGQRGQLSMLRKIGHMIEAPWNPAALLQPRSGLACPRSGFCRPFA